MSDIHRWVEKTAPYSGWISVLLLCSLWLAFLLHSVGCPSRQELNLLTEKWDVDTRNLWREIDRLKLQLEMNDDATPNDSADDP